MICPTHPASKETTMPSGPKKRRAQKNKKEVAAAAAREISENETTLKFSSKENFPVMQSGSTDGVTAVFDEPNVVLPKRTVLLESMLVTKVHDFKGKDTQEGIKENAVAAETYSSAPYLNVAEVAQPTETSLVAVGELSAVAAPGVIVLDKEDKDGFSMMFPDVYNFEGKETIVPTGIDSSVPVSEPHVSTPADESDAVYTDATELLQDGDEGSIVTTTACDNYMDAVDCSHAENSVSINGDATEDQRTLKLKENGALEKKQDLVTLKNNVGVESEDTAVVDDEDAPENAKAVQGEKVEAAGKYQEAVILEDVNNFEKCPFEVTAENKITAASNQMDAPEVTGEAGQVDEVKADTKNQEAANLEDVNDTEQLETIPTTGTKNQEAAKLENVNDTEKLETVPTILDVVAPNLAVDIKYQIHDAVSTELATPGVGKQLKEIKEMLEDVQNRLSAIDSLLGRN